MCRDYVTEKMIHALENEAVPVVYGDGNYRIFPRNSYIHAYDFPSPSKLAEYLLHLDKNDTEYNSYMEWRYSPRLVRSHGPYSAEKNGFCRLCQKLHLPFLPKMSRSYPSVLWWWRWGMRQKTKNFFNETLCREPDWLLGTVVNKTKEPPNEINWE